MKISNCTCQHAGAADDGEPATNAPADKPIRLEKVTPSNLALFKSTRLRALEESPAAFGSTYARESQLSDSEWLARAQNWDGARGIGFLAVEGDAACGIAGSIIDQSDPARALLVSMWVAPTHRRRGLGQMLVEKIARWLAARNVCTLTLMVTSPNQPAMRFYEELGFARTGRTEPYPNDPALIEYEMSRAIP